MPWTLYRYILKDLLKLLLLATTVLVIVVSFAAAVRPLREGLLGPALLMKFVFYATPTMLVYVLPLTAAFASTIVFQRMASDNEVIACSAVGMSYRKILAPVMGLAFVLTMGMFYLNNTIVPDFYQRAQQTARRDVISMLMAELKAGKPFKQGSWVVYADEANEVSEKVDIVNAYSALPDHKGHLPDRLLFLQGVAVAQIDKQGKIFQDGTAQKAFVAIYEHAPEELGGERDGDTVMSIKMVEASFLDEEAVPQYSRSIEVVDERIPGWETADLEFFTLAKLRRLGDEPDLYEPVRRMKLELARALAQARLQRWLMSQVTQPGGVELVVYSRTGEDRQELERYSITGPGFKLVQGDLLMEQTADQPIRVIKKSRAGTQVQQPETLLLKMEPDATEIDPVMSMELTRVQSLGPNGRVITEMDATLPVRHLRWPKRVLVDDGAVLTLQDLRDLAEDADLSSPPVEQAVQGLVQGLAQLKLEVSAQVQRRVASSVTCGLILIAGTLMAIRSRGQMPLVVYFWAFLLAILAVLLVNTGQRLITDGSSNMATGTGVLWLGNVILIVFSANQYRLLSRT